MRKELQAAFDLGNNLPAEELPRLLGDLEEVRAVAFARLIAPKTETRPDELLDVKETARRMHCSPDYLYRNSKKFKFTRREGRKLLFSSNALDSYLKQKSK